MWEDLHDGVKLFGYPIWGCIDNILQKSVKNKDLLNRCFHNSGNIDGQLQGRVVLRLFQPHDRLPPHPHFFG